MSFSTKPCVDIRQMGGVAQMTTLLRKISKLPSFSGRPLFFFRLCQKNWVFIKSYLGCLAPDRPRSSIFAWALSWNLVNSTIRFWIRVPMSLEISPILQTWAG